MSAQVDFVAATLPEGACYANEQERLNAYADALSGELPGTFTAFNFGSSTPAVGDQDKPWIRTGAAGEFDATYTFSQGQWVSPHPDFPGKVVLWEGDIGTIATLDGGAAGTVGTTSGPFWEAVANSAGRSPMGVGSLPSGQAIAVNTLFGEEKHKQTSTEVGTHSHTITDIHRGQREEGGGTTLLAAGTDGNITTDTNQENDVVQSMNVVHPVWGIHFIRRTGRLYRTA